MGVSHSAAGHLDSPRHSRDSSRSSNGRPMSMRRLSKPRTPLIYEDAARKRSEPSALGSILTYTRETLMLAGLMSGKIRIHEHDDLDRAMKHCHSADLPSLLTSMDDAEPPVAVLLLWGGLDIAVHQRGADEQSAGFELERIASQVRRGGVVALRLRKVQGYQVEEWLRVMGLDDIKVFVEDDAVTGRGHLPWKAKPLPLLRIGLCFTDKKRQAFANRFHADLDEEHIEFVEPEGSDPRINVDVVLCKGVVPPSTWERLPLVDDPHRATVLDDRLGTNNRLIQCTANHAIKVPKAWTSPELAVFPVVAKPNDAREHQGLFFAMDLDSLPAAPSCGWFLQQMIPHDSELLKVSVIGDHVSCARRPSATARLGSAASKQRAVCLQRAADSHPRKGGIVASFMDGDDDSTEAIATAASASEAEDDRISLPNRKALELLARAIQREFGISVFGFDMVVSKDDGQHYIVDINYFPSFADVPFLAKHLLLHLRGVAGKI